MVIGVLSLQGDVEAHINILTKCSCRPIMVKSSEEIKEIDGLIIPGGESVTIGKLLVWAEIDRAIIDIAHKGIPIFGTCAGMILLAKKIEKKEQFKLDLMDIEVKRNAFGRQRESFEADLDIPVLGEQPYRAIFIRAPHITKAKKEVKILARFDGKVVFVRQDNLLASAFHPELTSDLRIHQYFLGFVEKHRSHK